MADTSVFINGAADGSLNEAFSGLPPWATESTLFAISGILKKSLDIQTKTLTQILKKSGAGTGTDDTLDLAEKKTKADKAELERGKKKTAQDLMMTKMLTALISAGAKVLDVQQKYISVSNDLFKSGINLISGNDSTVSSMESMNQMVLLTGLRLETLQKVVEKYSSSINAVGITKFTKTLSQTNTRLTALGYSTEQQADLLGTMLEAESSYTDMRHRSESQISNDLAIFGERITKISLLTGQSTKQLQENIISLSKNTDSMDIEAEYGKDAADRVNAFAASFKDSNIAGVIQQFASTTSLGNEEMFQTLVKAGAGQEATQFNDTIQKILHGSISLESGIVDLTATAKKMNSAQIAALKTQQLGGNASAKPTRDFINSLRAQGNQLSEATTPQIDAATKSQASLSAFQSQVESAKATLEKAFPPLETQIDLATAGLKAFNDTMTSVIGSFSSTARSWVGVGVELIAAVAAVTLNFVALRTILGSAEAGGVIKSLGGLSTKAIGWTAAIAFAGIAGYEFGTMLYNFGSKFDSFNDYFDELFTSMDRFIALLPGGFGSDAQHRIDNHDTLASGGNSPSRISVPKTPMPSTITSPSAISTMPVTPPTDSAAPQASNVVVGSGIEKPPTTSDINSLMTYQNNLTAQMLIGVDKLIAVNNDILKYSRMHS